MCINNVVFFQPSDSHGQFHVTNTWGDMVLYSYACRGNDTFKRILLTLDLLVRWLKKNLPNAVVKHGDLPRLNP